MENKNVNYNQINNPTQINIGSSENSVQTINRKFNSVIHSDKFISILQAVNNSLIGLIAKAIILPALLLPIVCILFIDLFVDNGSLNLSPLYYLNSTLDFYKEAIHIVVRTGLHKLILLQTVVFSVYCLIAWSLAGEITKDKARRKEIFKSFAIIAFAYSVYSGVQKINTSRDSHQQ